MFALKERALIYVTTATIAATCATTYTVMRPVSVVSGESAEEQHSVTFKAAQSLSNSKEKRIIEESGLSYEDENIDYSTYASGDDDVSEDLYTDGSASTELSLEEVTAILTDLEIVYPTGTVWTNDTYYRCNGEGYATGGFGCAAFAYMASDSIYGSAGYHKSYDLNDLQPFDVAELYGGRHTVFILSVNEGTVTVAEANVNDMVRWGAEYSIDDITGILKRY